MNILNRLIIILIILVIMAGAITTFLIATETLSPEDFPDEWFEPQIQDISEADNGTEVAIIAVTVVIALVMLAWLIIEFVPRRRRVRWMIKSSPEGTATITRDSVCDLAEYAGQLNAHLKVPVFVCDFRRHKPSEAPVGLSPVIIEGNGRNLRKTREPVICK